MASASGVLDKPWSKVSVFLPPPRYLHSLFIVNRVQHYISVTLEYFDYIFSTNSLRGYHLDILYT